MQPSTQQRPNCRIMPWIQLSLLLLMVAISVTIALTGDGFMPDATESGNQDFVLYEAIVGRIHRGESYYQAAGTELRTPRGSQQLPYPTRSVFNWRQPILAWLLGQLPSLQVAHYLLLLTVITTLWVWRPLLQSASGKWRGIGQWLLLACGLLWAWPGWLPQAVVVHEIWGGTFIVLALGLQWRGWFMASWLVALTALGIRELVLPFYLMMLVWAWHDGKRRSVWFGLMGLCIWIAFYCVHWQQVQSLILPSDRAQERSWLQWGGWPFVLKTAHMHPLFLGWLPTAPWIVAALLPLSLFGFLLGDGPRSRDLLLLVACYLLMFCCVGQSFNYLWGLLYTPLWPLGLCLLPRAVVQRLVATEKAHAITT